jgi:hypothetical protein
MSNVLQVRIYIFHLFLSIHFRFVSSPLSHRTDNEKEMLLCDGCNLGYHMKCLVPKLKHVPRSEWLCPMCRPADPPTASSPKKKQRKSTSTAVKKSPAHIRRERMARIEQEVAQEFLNLRKYLDSFPERCRKAGVDPDEPWF